MLRGAVAFIAVLALAFAAGSPTPAAGATPRARPRSAPLRAPLPPELVALERAMLALQVNDESFSASVSISAPGAAGAPGGPFGSFSRVLARAAASLALLSVRGEESYAPQLAHFKGSVLGLSYEARVIGNTIYTEEPFISSLDGGRPWVEEASKGLSQAVGVELQSLGGSTTSNATRAFGPMLETLNGSPRVRDIGRYTVDGQATTGFRARVDLAAGRHLSATDRTLLRKLGGHTHLEVFLAADGLPVRTLLRFGVRLPNGAGEAELSIQSDIAAIDTPVLVEAPPAAKTITAAALERLLEAPAKHRAHAKAKTKTKTSKA